MKLQSLLAVFLGVTALAACDADYDRVDDLVAGHEAAAGKADSPTDLRASHCEVFIDKAYGIRNHHSAFGDAITLNVFVKTLNFRLDAAPVRVGFIGRPLSESTGAELDIDGGVGFRELKGLQLADDYAQIFLPVRTFEAVGSSVEAFDVRWEGAVFVETENGTRYWANAAESEPNFYFDQAMVENLDRIHGGPFGLTSAPPHLDTFAVTAGSFPYLNPGACR